MEEPVFDISKIDDYVLGHLEYITKSPSWADIFRPFLVNAKDMYTELCLDPNPAVRARYGGTKYLRSAANNMHAIITFFDKIIEETQDQRAIRARDESISPTSNTRAGAPIARDYPDDTEF